MSQAHLLSLLTAWVWLLMLQTPSSTSPALLSWGGEGSRPNDDEGNLPLQLPDQLPGDGHQELPGDTNVGLHQATDGQSCYDSSLIG